MFSKQSVSMKAGNFESGLVMAKDSKLLAAAAFASLAACGGGSSSSGGGGTPSVPVGGLDSRPSNLTCVAPALNPGAGSSIVLTPVFTGLTFSQPLAMVQAPGDSSRWFVVERAGRVRAFANNPSVSTFGTDFADIRARVDSNGEGGLLGMAFHPDFANDGRVFLSWTESGEPLVSVIASFTTVASGDAIDLNSEQQILRVNQDFANHNGGHIAFGADGYLYVGLGDGGSGGDPNSRAQDTTNLLGAMLRLDVDAGVPYTVPADNPFAGNALCPADHSSNTSCPEIFAWGLRNPWRWSFDRATGELMLGDVGQNAWEEVDRVALGGNYGWDCREGANPFANPAPSCSSATALIDPLHEYSHSLGNSITGGYVYRGAALPAMAGDYVFGDFGSGRIWRLVANGGGGFTSEELLDTTLSIVGFGEGDDGELYVVDIGGGLHRIDGGGGGGASSPVATLLSATGCVNPQTPSQPAAGLIEYAVAVPFWSDSADKSRWLAVPDGASIGVAADGDFALPNGSVLMKHFRLGNVLVETRLFMRHPDGSWAGYSYEWDAAQSDATLVQGGKLATVAGQSWIFPSENDCMSCHTQAAGFSLGLEAAQLNHAIPYAATGRTANQLASLSAISMFASPIGDPAVQPELPLAGDLTAALAGRARAYLHSNCANCHRPNGPTPSSMDLRFTTALTDTMSCDAVPQSGDLGLGANARIVAPGDPGLSVLLARMNRRDVNAMPPLASNLVDAQGVALVSDWIQSLTACQ